MYQYRFEKLDVWQLAKDLSKDIYLVTKEFPDDERYGLISQIRRASLSVCSNISEGTGRVTQNDQRHFYQMAYGSLMEVINQFIISHELGYIEIDVYEKLLRPKAERLSRMLFALINSLN
jgi:four helix bundle protein